MKNIPFEDYWVFAVSTSTNILPAHSASRPASHGAIRLLSSLKKVQEISNLVSNVLSSLEVINIQQQKVNSVVSIEYNEADHQWQA